MVYAPKKNGINWCQSIPFEYEMVELIGFEPTTCTLRTYRSSQLSYSPTGADRDRRTGTVAENRRRSTGLGKCRMGGGLEIGDFRFQIGGGGEEGGLEGEGSCV